MSKRPLIIKEVQRIDHNGNEWILVRDASKQEIKKVVEQFTLNSLLVQNLNHDTRQSRVEFYDDHAWIVLHFPFFDKETNEITSVEVDFIMIKNTLITISYGKFAPLEMLFHEFDAVGERREEAFSKNIGYLLYKILRELVEVAYALLEQLSKKIDIVEKGILKSNEKMNAELLMLRKQMLDFKRAVHTHAPLLHSLREKQLKMFDGPVTNYYLKDLAHLQERLNEAAENESHTLEILYDTYQALIGNKINQIMKLLTIFSVIVFPLTLFASIWGMNTRFTPIIGLPHDFWFIILLMAISTTGMLTFFKLKRWL